MTGADAHLRFAPLAATLLMLCSVPAGAEEPLAPLSLELHDVAKAIAPDGTVAVGVDAAALFAGPRGGALVRAKGSKVKVTPVTEHPLQDHHAASQSIGFAGHGVLTMLFDDRRRLRIVWYDVSKGTWSDIERPVGFVPKSHTMVGDVAVFPQGARAPAWFTFDPVALKFARLERPDEFEGCAGPAFTTGSSAAVAGRNARKTPCALAVNPVTKSWEQLPAPPVAACDAHVLAAPKTTYFFSDGCGSKGRASALSFDGATKKWSTVPSPPSSFIGAQLFASARQIGAWRLHSGRLRSWSLDRNGKEWAQTDEALPFDLRSVAATSASSWWALGEVRGAPRLLRLRYDPKLSAAQRARNRSALPDLAAPVVRDWKTASEKERRAAIKQGLGSVERYVPPELDDKGKVVTQGAWVFSLGEELVVWPATPKKCAKFIERLVSRWPTSEVGEQWVVERGDGLARVGKKLLYGPAAACRPATACKTDYYSERNVPLSQVGPVFSYSSHTSEARDCAAPSANERWHAVDLRTLRAAELTAVIDEGSLLAALKSHKTLRKHLSESETLSAAIAKLRALDPLGFQGYAFGGWRKMTRRVELRIEFHPNSPDYVEPIKVWVTPKDEYIEVFEAAARQPGAMMSGSQ